MVGKLYQIALGMAYLHGKNVIHCDLKAVSILLYNFHLSFQILSFQDNILIDESKNAMVADFGVASIQDLMSRSAATLSGNSQHGNGTLRWMAPERLEGQSVQKSSDVYSFAITAWELYSSGEIPFSMLPDSIIVSLVLDRERRPSRPARLQSDDLWSIITACWLQDPKGRPIFDDVHIKLKKLLAEGMYYCFALILLTIHCISSNCGDSQ